MRRPGPGPVGERSAVLALTSLWGGGVGHGESVPLLGDDVVDDGCLAQRPALRVDHEAEVVELLHGIVGADIVDELESVPDAATGSSRDVEVERRPLALAGE